MPTAENMVVKGRNVGDRDVTITHLGEKITIPAGKERVVPWDAMASLWGDPGVVDTRAGSRQEQAERHRGQFGWFKGLNAEDEWDEMAPRVEWYTLDGDRIWTVLDDPTGEKAAEAGWDRPNEGVADVDYLRRQMAEMERQLAQLQTEQDQRNTAAQQAHNEPAKDDADSELPKPDPDAKATKDDHPSQPRTGTKGR